MTTAIIIEAYLTPSRCWWVMPYRFTSRDLAATFLDRLRSENRGRHFRIGGAA